MQEKEAELGKKSDLGNHLMSALHSVQSSRGEQSTSGSSL